MTICLKIGSVFPTLAKPFARLTENRGGENTLFLVTSGRGINQGLNFRASFAIIHQAAYFFNGKYSMPILLKYPKMKLLVAQNFISKYQVPSTKYQVLCISTPANPNTAPAQSPPRHPARVALPLGFGKRWRSARDRGAHPLARVAG